MTHSLPSLTDTPSAVPPAAALPEIRAERRRRIEGIRALRRLLDKRHAFEVADRRRLNREARDRGRAEDAHGRVLHRIDAKQARQERSLGRRLNGLDGKREHQERRALAVLRRESIQRTLNSTHLTASQVNGIGSGLVRDLAAQGIRTAADFTRVSWGKAPNGKGGEVLYIHRTHGRKVHINGIGEHRGRPLLEWRKAAVARAEARAPHELPPDERHRIAEIIEAERARLREELAKVPRAADAAREDAVRLHDETLAHLTTAERKAARLAAERRADFDTMAEQLLALQAELSAHIDQYGDTGRRVRRAQARALRPVPALPAVPAPRAPLDLTKQTPAAIPAPTASVTAPTARASLGWLVPVLYFALTTVVGVGELGEGHPPLWLRVASRVLALAAGMEILRLWLPRRRRRTAAPMPSGTGAQAIGVFLALTATGMFTDPERNTAVTVTAWIFSALSVLLLISGVGLRMENDRDRQQE